jgi:hypothetical protein
MQNKIEKIQPVIDHVRSVCLKIPMEEHLACDEQIVPFKGRISIKTYNPKKLHKWGYKIWVLSGISGFSYDFELFSGKVVAAGGEDDFGSACNVVYRMSRNVPKKCAPQTILNEDNNRCRVCRATCTSPLVELIFRSFVCNKWSFYCFIGVIVRFVPVVRFPTADLVSLFQQLSYFNRFLKQTFLSYRCFLTA